MKRIKLASDLSIFWAVSSQIIVLVVAFMVLFGGNSFDYTDLDKLYSELETSSVDVNSTVETEVVAVIENPVVGQEVWIRDDMVVLGMIEDIEVGDKVDFSITDARKMFEIWYIIVE